MRLQQNLEGIRSASDLGEVLICILGLWEMGYTDEVMIGDVLQCKPGKMRAFCRKIEDTRNRVLRRFSRRGLPDGLYGRLPFGDSVLCTKCGRLVHYVPCPVCKQLTLRGLMRTPGQCEPALLPASPTIARPGSLAKIEIMAKRLAREEELFHPGDILFPMEGGGYESKQGSGSQSAFPCS